MRTNYVIITVWYGTFICDLGVLYTMSQMLTSKPRGYVLYSELHFEKPKVQLKSAASEALCSICKSVLKEGSGLTAMRVGKKTLLVCGSHDF